jgi:hypothetical protein
MRLNAKQNNDWIQHPQQRWYIIVQWTNWPWIKRTKSVLSIIKNNFIQNIKHYYCMFTVKQQHENSNDCSISLVEKFLHISIPLSWFYVTKHFMEYKRLRNSNPTKHIVNSYCCISGTCRVNEIQEQVILYYYEKIIIFRYWVYLMEVIPESRCA